MIGNFPTIIDNTFGLITRIRAAVGPNNFRNISPDITPERFKCAQDVRTVNLELVPFLDREKGRQCATRLLSEGFVLENIGELADFFFYYPEEVEKYRLVVALGESSRLTDSNGDITIPGVRVMGTDRVFGLAERVFGLYEFDDSVFSSSDRVLVSRRQPL